MGLSGVAFILQADVGHRWDGKIDAGWWPLDPWGLKLHREFLSRAIGRELVEVGCFYDSHEWPRSPDEKRDLYLMRMHKRVMQEVNSGRPVLMTFAPTESNFGYIITGYDTSIVHDRPPVWGRCATDTEGRYGYSVDWPLGVLLVGDRLAPMDDDEADIAALRQALTLARDEAGPHEEEWRDRRFTGRKAWSAWSKLLRNTDEPTESRHHWNVRGNLIANRTAAVAYLQAVADRRDGRVAEELHAAATAYEKELDRLRAFRPGNLNDVERRHALAEEVDRMAALEREAVLHMEQALAAIE
jgi:hypothetical protein